jgi:transcriptional regulator GlxA family with amidase domain
MEKDVRIRGSTVLADRAAKRETAQVRSSPQRIVLVAFEGMQLLDIVGPAEVFDAANRLLGDHRYDVLLSTPDGRAVRSRSGLRISADVSLTNAQARGLDTLIAGGGMNIREAMADRRLLDGLRRLSAGARRTCSVCTGAFLLGKAGLLRGRRATTHWAFCAELAQRYPETSVEPDRIFVRDGAITTSAGVSAGIDLALALVQDDHGAELARSVARWLVVFLQRPGGQSQFSERLSLPASAGAQVRAVLDQIVAEPAADHRQAQLARRASLSERHLRRLFVEQTNTTPARFVERVRVETARALLESSFAPVETVAAQCGFGSAETMRRAFLRVLGVGPGEYRERFGKADRGPLRAAARS